MLASVNEQATIHRYAKLSHSACADLFRIDFIMLSQVAKPFLVTDRRAGNRIIVRLSVVAGTKREARSFGMLDISSTGCMVAINGNLDVGEKATVEFPGGLIETAEVVWCHGEKAGLEFVHPLSKAVLSSARLRSDHHFSETDGASFDPANEDAFGRFADVPDSEKLPLHQRVRIILFLALLPWAIGLALALAL
jgi:hypothetical protein